MIHLALTVPVGVVGNDLVLGRLGNLIDTGVATDWRGSVWSPIMDERGVLPHRGISGGVGLAERLRQSNSFGRDALRMADPTSGGSQWGPVPQRDTLGTGSVYAHLQRSQSR